MRRSTRITKVDRQGQRATLVTWRGGGRKGQLEIQGGMTEFREWINDQIRDNDELLVALALKHWLVNNPASQDFTSIEGKTITIDLTLPATSGLMVIQ